MTTVLVVAAVVAAVIAAAVGFPWRDRQRSTTGEDWTAARDARASQQRYEGERHAAQSDTVRRGQFSSGGM